VCVVAATLIRIETLRQIRGLRRVCPIHGEELTMWCSHHMCQKMLCVHCRQQHSSHFDMVEVIRKLEVADTAAEGIVLSPDDAFEEAKEELCRDFPEAAQLLSHPVQLRELYSRQGGRRREMEESTRGFESALGNFLSCSHQDFSDISAKVERVVGKFIATREGWSKTDASRDEWSVDCMLQRDHQTLDARLREHESKFRGALPNTYGELVW